MLALLEILGFVLELLYGAAELIGGWMQIQDGRATRPGESLSVQRKRELDARLKHPKELQRLLDAQQRRQAIQLYRKETGANATEGRIAVHALANKILVKRYETQLIKHDKTAVAEIHVLLEQGKKRKAIQVYRATTGAGLLEGVKAVNVLESEWSLQQLT